MKQTLSSFPTYVLTFVFSAAMLASAWAAPSDVSSDAYARGHEDAMRCFACHGMKGVSNAPMIPVIGGQKAEYLERQLQHFRNGKRYNPMMSPVAESLSDQEIHDLATYFSAIGPDNDPDD